MIFDSIVNTARYEALNPRFAAAFRHYAGLANRADLAPGRHDLEKDGSIYAVVVDALGRAPADVRLETHRAYIDIQITTGGCDRIGWAPAPAIGAGYDAATDTELLTAAPITWLDVPAGHFAIFFPEDAHAPMANGGQPIRKIVLKVAV